jgi:monoglucosyldiacylglycerol epimerase
MLTPMAAAPPPPMSTAAPDLPEPMLTVAITGASGALGQALLRSWHRRGARLIAISHGAQPLDLRDRQGQPIPLQQISWQVGQEQALLAQLTQVDVLVLNHGVNLQRQRSVAATETSLTVNALSSWRLLEGFAAMVAGRSAAEQGNRPRPEVWINTSEAEVQPAFSPLYEISKRLLGQLLSLRSLDLSRQLRLRRLVLGPFRSALNPVGVMGAGFVAEQVLLQARLGCNLIIVTPNPLVYVLMPLATLSRWLYNALLTRP